jgi:hypothetical protein
MAVIGKPIPEDAYPVPPIPTHTDEARELLTAGVIAPGDPALDLPIDSMMDREILVEILVHERNNRDAIRTFIESVNASPLGSMIRTGSMGSMFGNGTRPRVQDNPQA